MFNPIKNNNTMKHRSIKLIAALLAVLALSANAYGQYYAYDFSATAPSGQTLYYKIYDSTQVSVVHPRTSTSDSNYVSGDLIIPETVSYCGTTYTVTELKTHNFMMGAFFNCKTLTSVYVPNTVKSMGDYVFGYCSSLVSVHLPDSITVIPSEAFKGCTALPTITLGRCVSRINSDAFLHCWSLMEMHLLNNVAPSVGYRALWDIPDSASVYIPCGSTASYMSVQEWSQEYFSFIEELGYVLDVTASNEEYGSAEIVSEPTCNNLQAELLATANEGYHFEGWSITPGYQNIVTDNPLILTVTEDMSIVAYFSPDSTEGIEGVEALNAKVYINNGQIVVDGAEGNMVWLYDAAGRLLATRQDNYAPLRFDVPATGAYLIKVGSHPARRVVVVR